MDKQTGLFIKVLLGKRRTFTRCTSQAQVPNNNFVFTMTFAHVAYARITRIHPLPRERNVDMYTGYSVKKFYVTSQ